MWNPFGGEQRQGKKHEAKSVALETTTPNPDDLAQKKRARLEQLNKEYGGYEHKLTVDDLLNSRPESPLVLPNLGLSYDAAIAQIVELQNNYPSIRDKTFYMVDRNMHRPDEKIYFKIIGDSRSRYFPPR